MQKGYTLEKRMRRYEAVSDIRLIRRIPLILRLDGVHFKSFTRGLKKPFDEIFKAAMAKTMLELCKSIEGVVFGYVQSDEITLVLVDYKELDTDAWFDYRLQKLCSVSASMCSRFFNRIFRDEVEKSDLENKNTYRKKYDLADFDCRAFNIPKEDVCNCILWRQRDAERNSIQSLAQSLYSHKEIIGLNTNILQDKIFTEKGINWNDLCTYYKRGCACIKDTDTRKWRIDYNMPILSKDRNYIEKLINFDDVEV